MSLLSETFINAVKKGLESSSVDLSLRCKIAAAVSGGADSISLLYSLCEIFDLENIFVITVNHNLRAEEETSSDADFVEECCRTLDVKCFRVDVERGKIESLAKKRGMGIEDAARKVRYDIFEDFIAKEKIDYLCLAHNKNDAGETLLMRFLKGSSIEGLCSIPRVRGKYIRPLLDISRSQIEEFLSDRKLSFRTDSTNSDSSMTRNFLRNEVIPLIRKKLSGWQNAVISASEKNKDDEDFIASYVKEALLKINYSYSKEENKVSFDSFIYSDFHSAVRYRILFKALKDAKSESLISNDFIKETDKNICNRKDFTSFAFGLCIEVKKNRIEVYKKNTLATEKGFSVIIEEEGSFLAGDLKVDVKKYADSVCIECNEKKIILNQLDFPFAFRSFQPSDKIKKSDGSFKSVSKVLDDLKAGSLKSDIPVIQELSLKKSDNFMQIKCIFAGLFGFKNWIVK